MRGVLVVGAVDDNLCAIGKGDIDSHLIALAMVLVLVWRIERYPATRDAIIELLKFRNPFSDGRFQRRRGVHVVEGYLQLRFHG